jgi:hypothetical protein
MDVDRIMLFEGAEGDPATGDGWLPSVWLERDGTDLYLGVNEEVAGVAEGVPRDAFDAIRARQLTGAERRVLLAAVMGDHMNPDDLNTAVAKLESVLDEDGGQSA